MEPTVCELFAGIGGFRYGLEKAGPYRTVWMNQWEPSRKRQDAYECYCHHYGHMPYYSNKDIASVEKSRIPDHALLVGGFPCQDYSVAATGAKGIKGKKGVLWWQIYAILSAKRPPFVLLENVDRLLKSPAKQRGRDFGIILSCFRKLGYGVEWRVINAADYGFVQRRHRTFLFAFHESTRYAENLSDATSLLQDGFFSSTFPVRPPAAEAVRPGMVPDILTASASFSFPFLAAGVLMGDQFVTSAVTPVQELGGPVLKSILDRHPDEHFFLGDDLSKWKYLKGAKKMQRVNATGYTYTYSEGPVGFPDSVLKPARTILTSEGQVNRSTHVIEDPQQHRLRILTPEECEAIQGFPKGWTATGMSERFRYFCCGNALVTGLVTRMGKALLPIIRNE